MSVTIQNPNLSLPIWHWSGPARRVTKQLLANLDTVASLSGKYNPDQLRLFAEAAGALINFPPDQGVVVEIRYPATQREHVVVAPCELVTE